MMLYLYRQLDRETSMSTAFRMVGLVPAGIFAALSTAQAADAPYTVEVVAARPATNLDFQVYDVNADLRASISTVADLLNNIPSVSVDPDGTARLRGNQNVTILVDGKPLALLQGENRAAALNAMSAGFIQSVQVINNPGAEYGSEDRGGPILNLVTRRNRRSGNSGSSASGTVNAGAGGRYNGNLIGSYNAGDLSIDNFLDYRRDIRGNTSTTTRERIDASSRAVSPSAQESTTRELNGTLNFNSNFRYNFGEADRLGASLGYQQGERDGASLEHYRDYAPDGTLSSERWRESKNADMSRSFNAGVSHDHRFEGEDEDLKLDFRLSSSRNTSDNRARSMDAASPEQLPNQMSRQQRAPSTRIADFTADYTAKQGKGFLTAGIKAVDTRKDFDSLYADIDPASGSERINPALTNAFSVDEHLLAAYHTWEYRVDERWTAKTGLRAERTQLDIRQITSGIDAANSYTNYMPSAYLSYQPHPDATVRFAYSRRVQRPDPNALNPYVVFQSPTDRSSGNPQLKPSQADTFELGYGTTLAGVKTDLRLFTRNEDDVITPRQTVIKDETGQDVVLTAPQNFGQNRSQGLEFAFNGKPTPALSVNISGVLRHAEQTQVARPGMPDTISDTSLTGHSKLDYRLTPEDQLQFAVSAYGKQLWAQGYREMNWNSDFTWQRKLTPTLAMLVNINDPFNSNRNESRTDAEFLRQTSVSRVDGRIFYIGLRYELGMPRSGGM
jgi:outer membrane receptor protein involved in Fe transport